jgi:hypothetical protein
MNCISDNEQIANELKQVDGYLACEKIIIKNIVMQLDCGLDDVSIENYLKELVKHLECMYETVIDNNFRINYLFAGGFINTLLRVPAWSKWIKTIGI